MVSLCPRTRSIMALGPRSQAYQEGTYEGTGVAGPHVTMGKSPCSLGLLPHLKERGSPRTLHQHRWLGV